MTNPDQFTQHAIDDIAHLPRFVQKRFEYLKKSLQWTEKTYCYYELEAKLSNGYYSVRASIPYIIPLNIWIASDDNCSKSVYIAGSRCWINPNSSSLFFDKVDASVELDENNQYWWMISYADEKPIRVYKIHIKDTVAYSFPDFL